MEKIPLKQVHAALSPSLSIMYHKIWGTKYYRNDLTVGTKKPKQNKTESFAFEFFE